MVNEDRTVKRGKPAFNAPKSLKPRKVIEAPKEVKRQVVPTKAVKNECLQSLEIYFKNSEGQDDTCWLQPRGVLKLPASCLTSQIDLLQKRRLVRVYNI